MAYSGQIAVGRGSFSKGLVLHHHYTDDGDNAHHSQYPHNAHYGALGHFAGLRRPHGDRSVGSGAGEIQLVSRAFHWRLFRFGYLFGYDLHSFFQHDLPLSFFAVYQLQHSHFEQQGEGAGKDGLYVKEPFGEGVFIYELLCAVNGPDVEWRRFGGVYQLHHHDVGYAYAL